MDNKETFIRMDVKNAENVVIYWTQKLKRKNALLITIFSVSL